MLSYIQYDFLGHLHHLLHLSYTLSTHTHIVFHVVKENDKREIKFDVTWSYVKRQTAKMTSEFVFFSSNPSLNHIQIKKKCLLLITTNTNIFTLLFNKLKTDGKSFIFAVCRLT